MKLAYSRLIQWRIIPLLFIFNLVYFGVLAQVPLSYKFTRINESNGLLNNTINDIDQDSLGFIWIATDDGLYRYDGHNFESYRRDRENSNSLPNNFIQSVHIDKSNKIWVLTDYGIGVYNYKEDSFTSLLPYVDSVGLNYRSVTSITEGDEFKVVGTFGGGVSKVKNNQFEEMTPSNLMDYPFNQQTVSSVQLLADSVLYIGSWEDGLYNYNLHTNNIEKVAFEDNSYRVFDIYKDDENRIWAGTNRGVILIDAVTKKETLLSFTNNKLFPIDDYLSALVDGDYLWLGTRNNGLLKIELAAIKTNPTSFKVQQFRYSQNVDGLSSKTVSEIFKDRDGNIWLGTHNGGINVFNPAGEKVIWLTQNSTDESSLSLSKVWGITEDEDGVIWAGTDGEGIDLYNPYRNTTTPFGKNNELVDKAILSLLKDSQGNLWVGTYQGGIMKFDTRERSTAYGSFLKSQDVRCIYETNKGEILIGTNGRGIYRYRPIWDDFVSIAETAEFDVRDIKEGDNNILWLGTYGDGLVKLNTKTNKISKIDNWHSGSDQVTPIIHSLYKSENRIWIGTQYSGLVLFDIHDLSYSFYDESKGLINNTVRSIISDEKGYLWVSTNTGVSSINIASEAIRNFNSYDGFQNGQFNDNSGLLSRDGRIGFGGIYGFNLFSPDQLLVANRVPNVELTSFEILNEKSDVTLKTPSISILNELELAHDDNFFQISFSPVIYPFNDKWNVESKLEGYEKKWIQVGAENDIIYRGIAPGKYTLKLRVNNGTLIGKEKILLISILSPWWQTWYAYFLYVLLTMLIIGLIIRYSNQRTVLKQKLIYEQKLRVQEGEIMQRKLRFFTNFSHELRTPLTLITGPINDLINNFKHKEEVLDLLVLMNRNGRLLKKLVNRLLEFRKIETEKTILNIGFHDINILLQEESESFQYQAISKKINIHLNSNHSINGWIDIEKLQICLNNILSNAIKYTNENGHIWIDAKIINKSLHIEIRDDGVGIDSEDITFVFAPFFQGKNSAGIGGTGIGLSLCKSLIENQKGSITASSTIGEGTKFAFTLPISKIAYEDRKDVRFVLTKDYSESESTLLSQLKQDGNEELVKSVNEKIIIAVDDNPDIVNYLQKIFKNDFTVIPANNGLEALKLIESYIPDLVISDIMMPVMTGIELCSIVKSKEATSHIPFILLTAKDGSDSKVEGFKEGADDYVTKPFISEVLKSRVNNLIESRKKLKNHFVSLEETIEVEESEEYRFLKKVEAKVVDNLDNDSFSVPSLAHELGYSRTSLYRKIKALTGQSINQFMRSLKMKKAAELLSASDVTVSEVAFSLGFTDLKYFRVCFKEHFDMLPSEYHRKNSNSEVDVDALKAALRI